MYNYAPYEKNESLLKKSFSGNLVLNGLIYLLIVEHNL